MRLKNKMSKNKWDLSRKYTGLGLSPCSASRISGRILSPTKVHTIQDALPSSPKSTPPATAAEAMNKLALCARSTETLKTSNPGCQRSATASQVCRTEGNRHASLMRQLGIFLGDSIANQPCEKAPSTQEGSNTLRSQSHPEDSSYYKWWMGGDQ